MEQTLVTKFKEMYETVFKPTIEFGKSHLESPESSISDEQQEGYVNSYRLSSVRDDGFLEVKVHTVPYTLPTIQSEFSIYEEDLEAIMASAKSFEELVSPIVVKAINKVYMELECKNRNNTNLVGTKFLEMSPELRVDLLGKRVLTMTFTTIAEKKVTVLASAPAEVKKYLNYDKLLG